MYIISVYNKSPRSTQPGHPSTVPVKAVALTGTLHNALVPSIILQCKLVSGWRLRKRWSPLYELCGLGRALCFIPLCVSLSYVCLCMSECYGSNGDILVTCIGLAIPLWIGKMCTGNGYTHHCRRNVEFCVTIGPVTRTASIHWPYHLKMLVVNSVFDLEGMLA